jgi:AcrR family transcriptional regulator
MTEQPRGTRTPARNGVRWSTDQLLDIADEVFAERGYHEATMSAITEHARSTKATFYGRFGSKDQLYAACLERQAERLRAHLVRAYESSDSMGFEQKIDSDMLAFFEHAAGSPIGFSLLFGPEAAGPAARIRQRFLDQIRDQVARRLRPTIEGRERGDSTRADLLAAMIVGVAVQGTYQTVLAGGAQPVDDASMQAASTLASSFVAAALRNLDPRLLQVER